MVKIIIKIEEKETLSFRGIEGKNVICDITTLDNKCSNSEKEIADEIISRATNNHKTVEIIDKCKRKNDDVEKIKELLNRI